MTTSRRSGGESTRERRAPDGTELLALELQQIRSAESELSRILPSLAEAVESEELRELLELRVKQGKRLLGELEAAFDELEEEAPQKKNVAAEGLIEATRDRRSMQSSSPASRRSSTTASPPGAPPDHWPRPPGTRPPCARWSRS
jgi:hypothetical protein